MNQCTSQQGCPNKLCTNYGKNGDEFIAAHDKKQSRLRCRTCRKTWSAHSKEFYYGLRTEQVKIRRTLDLLREKIPIRKIAGFVNVSSSTIQRWKSRFKNIT